jgi:hypothetical protein
VRRGSGISFGERGGTTNLSNGSTGPNSLAATRRQHRSDAWAAKEEASRPGGIARHESMILCRDWKIEPTLKTGAVLSKTARNRVQNSNLRTENQKPTDFIENRLVFSVYWMISSVYRSWDTAFNNLNAYRGYWIGGAEVAFLGARACVDGAAPVLPIWDTTYSCRI